MPAVKIFTRLDLNKKSSFSFGHYLETEAAGDDLEIRSKLEHNRWSTEKIAEGWKYNESRNDPLKSHHDLLPYDSLTDKTKAKSMSRNNLNKIELLPQISCISLAPSVQVIAGRLLTVNI